MGDQGQQGVGVGVLGNPRRELLLPARSAGADRVAGFTTRTVLLPQRDEGPAEELAELVLAREPERLLLGNGVQRPLGGPVEAEDGAGRVLANLDGHLAQREDLAAEGGLRKDEAVARSGRPPQAGIAKGLGTGLGDHAPSLTCPAPGGQVVAPVCDWIAGWARRVAPVSYTHLRAHETRHDLVCRLL